ncbi:alpha/beta hydrolase family protein [Haloferula sargassicola]|uniref:2-succinyl-6-hydroxy-2, 4-cyclohexadiene-1-carboxylate synthase n=1 Tax=Haloferula sargassicola TaxID=490096 RepID=A0ABP9UN65_9BACT
MKRLRRWLQRIAFTSSLLALAALSTIGWLGSGHLVEPKRRALQDYHLERLEHPAAFGLKITAYTGPEKTPCLLVEPEPGGRGWRARDLRKSLKRPPPWGEILGTVVMLNGHGGRKEDHLPSCERFTAAGFRCLVPDLPGHGDHPAPHATFGKDECELIEALVDDLPGRFSLKPQPVFLYGVSQGGAIALQTAARSPQRWAGVISAAAFASLERTVERSAAELAPKYAGLAPVAAFSVGCGSWLRAGYAPWQIRPAKAAEKLTMPVMIIHGENDRFIPFADAREIFDRIPAETKILRPVVDGTHGRVLATDAGHLYPEMCRFLLDAVR